MGAHINAEGKFQSDKYPTCPAGKVPLSVKDKAAQDLLWEYAQRRREVDAEFSDDLEASLLANGYEPRPAIERAHVFILRLGADTRRDLANTLHCIATDIDRDEITAGVSGGYSSGYTYAYRQNTGQTHDKYFAEIEASLNAERAKVPA